MNTERIEISNFGPIESATIELNKLIVLVGPQAGGKSTIAKLIYLFRLMKRILSKPYFERIDNIVSSKSKEVIIDFENINEIFKNEIIGKINNIFGKEFLKSEYRIKFYISKDKCFELYRTSYGEELKAPDDFKELISELNKFFVDVTDENNSLFVGLKDKMDRSQSQEFKSYLMSYQVKLLINSKIEDYFNNNRDAFFIPAGRAAFSLLSNQFALLNLSNVEEVYKKFINKIKNVYQHATYDEFFDNISPWVDDTLLRDLLSDSFKIADRILKGTYTYFDGEPRIHLGNDEYIRLNYASSGQQEAISIVLICLELISISENNFVVIEEPEAHLFPQAQFDIVKLISNLLNNPGTDNNIVITTHSPYILSSINCLLLGGNNLGNIEEKSKILDKKYWIDNNSCNAYSVDRRVEAIMDSELGILDLDYVDSISTSINDIHSKFIELKYKV